MKKNTLLLLVLSIFSFKVQSQTTKKLPSGKITYEAIIKNSLFISGSADKVDTTDLYFNDTSSVYTIRQQLLPINKIMQNLDNVSQEVKLQIAEQLKTRVTKLKLNYNYHKAGTDIISYPWDTPAGDKSYCVSDTIPPFNWELRSDTMTILGFVCQKAVSTTKAIGNIARTYTAWYTPDLPVAYGPFRFYGLPGLILDIESQYYSYKAVAIQFPLPVEGQMAIGCCKGLPTISKKQVIEISGKQQEDLRNMQKLGKN